MAMMAPMALMALVAASQAKKQKAPDMPLPPQEEKAPDASLFRRRNATGMGAYGLTSPAALSSASTGTTKLGQ